MLGDDADLLEAAAWLHDIGYAADLAVTGPHALDGARYLRDAQHADTMLGRFQLCHEVVRLACSTDVTRRPLGCLRSGHDSSDSC